MRKPDFARYNPEPDYLRGLIKQAGLSQRQAAARIGLSLQGLQNYIRPKEHPLYRAAPYQTQYALEGLADPDLAD